jgi:histidinol-phosphate aminotransferase
MSLKPAPPACIREFLQDMPPKFDPPTLGVLRHAGYDTSTVRPMGLNECLFPPSPRVLAAISAALSTINRYPDAQCPALTDVIVARTGVPPEHVVWGNGSEELIKGAVELSSGPGTSVVLPVPTFWGYRAIVRASGARLVEASNGADGMPDVERIAARVAEDTRLVFCITPNNPSGAMLPQRALEALARLVPANRLLFIDEAYHEFAVHAGGPDVLAALRERDGPWVVARTFSKAYAMAGMRIGYALCSSEALAQALKQTTCVFNVPILAQAAALAALDDTAYLREILDRTAAGRRQLSDGLREVGLAPLASVGNFVSVRLPVPGRDVVKDMLERGIQLHAWPDVGYESFIRITVGSVQDNAACLEALGKSLHALGSHP